MYKYKEDEDEQLQRLRKALPKICLVWSKAAKQENRAGISRSKEINGHTACLLYTSDAADE